MAMDGARGTKIAGVVSPTMREKAQHSTRVRKANCTRYFDQFVSSIFLVPKRDGNSCPFKRFKCLQYTHFKMEGIYLLRDLLQPNDWLGKIDLKDAYFVISIQRNRRKYQRFVWKQTLLDFACFVVSDRTEASH